MAFALAPELPAHVNPPALVAPAAREASFGRISGTVQPGTYRVVVRVNGKEKAAARVGGKKFELQVDLPPRDATIEVVAEDALGNSGKTRIEKVLGLPATGAPVAAETHEDASLAAAVDELVDDFPAISAVYVENLQSGAGAAWNATAHFPAASTVKLAIAVETLRILSDRPEEGTELDVLLRDMLVDSDNEAANALLRWIGSTESGGAEQVNRTLGALDLDDTHMYGGFLIASTGPPIPLETESQPDVRGQVHVRVGSRAALPPHPPGRARRGPAAQPGGDVRGRRRARDSLVPRALVGSRKARPPAGQARDRRPQGGLGQRRAPRRRGRLHAARRLHRGRHDLHRRRRGRVVRSARRTGRQGRAGTPRRHERGARALGFLVVTPYDSTMEIVFEAFFVAGFAVVAVSFLLVALGRISERTLLILTAALGAAAAIALVAFGVNSFEEFTDRGAVALAAAGLLGATIAEAGLYALARGLAAIRTQEQLIKAGQDHIAAVLDAHAKEQVGGVRPDAPARARERRARAEPAGAQADDRAARHGRAPGRPRPGRARRARSSRSRSSWSSA